MIKSSFKEIFFYILTYFFIFTLFSLYFYCKSQDFKLTNLFFDPKVSWGWPSEDSRKVNNISFQPKFTRGKISLQKGKALILIGGSNTFGQGIYDTSPDRILETGAQNTDVFTIAYPGWSINNLLPLFERFSYEDLVQRREAFFVYQLPFYHLDRVCGSSDVMSWSHGKMYRYYLKSEKIIKGDKYRESIKFHISLVIQGIIKQLKDFGLVNKYYHLSLWEKTDSVDCIKLTGELIKKLQGLILKQYKGAKFAVLLIPTYSHFHSLIIKTFTEIGLNVIDMKDSYEKFQKESPNSTHYQDDGHFTENFYNDMLPFYKNMVEKF